MIIKKNTTKNTTIYSLSGKFTFSDHQAFRAIVNAIKGNESKSVYLELSEMDFIDSAGLGMLLVARDEASKNNIDFRLLGPTGHVQKMFTLSNFQALFRIE